MSETQSSPSDQGTLEFWVDPKKNPGSFTDGVNYKWGVFQLGMKNIQVLSEGKMLRAVMDYGTESEVEIFATTITADAQKKNYVVVTWSPSELNLYFNGQCLHTVNPTRFLS